jgi:hypothetical protein
LDKGRSFPVTARTMATRRKKARGTSRRKVSLDRRNLNVMARYASPGVVARIVHHPAGGKQGRDEKGERRSDPPGIETEVQALYYVSVAFLKEGDVILI